MWFERLKKQCQSMINLYENSCEFRELAAVSINSTYLNKLDKIYDLSGIVKRYDKTPVTIVDAKTIETAMQYKNENTFILNFASPKTECGGWKNGSLAQEESIAYVSTLYWALKNMHYVYEFNKNNLNNGLYNDNIIVTNKLAVVAIDNGSCFESIQPWYCGCITSAAPNRNATDRKGISSDIIKNCLEVRVDKIFASALEAGCETFVVGAFGCGVYKNNPYDVAAIMKNACRKYSGYFKRIIFAIPKGRNLDVFYSVMSDSTI